MAIAGHVSPKMLAHYSHVRMEAKRKALDMLSTGYATKDATSGPFAEMVQPEVIENVVSAAGLEPATHALKGHCSTN